MMFFSEKYHKEQNLIYDKCMRDEDNKVNLMLNMIKAKQDIGNNNIEEVVFSLIAYGDMLDSVIVENKKLSNALESVCEKEIL